jgi:hypothetical protein
MDITDILVITGRHHSHYEEQYGIRVIQSKRHHGHSRYHKLQDIKDITEIKEIAIKVVSSKT